MAYAAQSRPALERKLRGMNNYAPPAMTSLGFELREKPYKRRADGLPPGVKERKARILVVDNDPGLRRLLSIRLGAANYEVESVDSAEAALDACVRMRPNLVITELRMERMNGLELLNELKCRWPDLSVIILTGHGSIPGAVQATQCGAFGFLVKPVEKSELLAQAQRAIAASSFNSVEGDWRAQIVSRSQLMEERLGQANRAARTDAPVLLTGECGTGKELLARAIHAASARSEKPFIAVACRHVAEGALEMELFGAESDSPGALDAANGGTLLLDEIGDLPLRLQDKLMKELHEDLEFSSKGAALALADVRLICTSSQDLKQLVDSGRMSEDLYYRINVLPIEVPSLGRRREDIPLLVSHFLEQATEAGGVAKKYTPEALQLLVTTNWPGNVRQLFDLVKQHACISQGKTISKEFVQQSLTNDSTALSSYDDARDEFSREYLTKNLASTLGNVTKSARLAKRNRTDFYKLLARYRLLPADFTKSGAASRKAIEAAEALADSPDDAVR